VARSGAEEVLAIMREAERTGKYITFVSSHSKQATIILGVSADQQAADTLFEHLWTCKTCKHYMRDTFCADYVVIWHGFEFYRARLANGKYLSKTNFLHYLEEITP
jgi:hypothetical protein